MRKTLEPLIGMSSAGNRKSSSKRIANLTEEGMSRSTRLNSFSSSLPEPVAEDKTRQHDRESYPTISRLTHRRAAGAA